MEIVVSSNGALVSALASAQSGDVILLAAGNYGTIALQNKAFAGAGITIASADANQPAVVAGVEISDTSGVTFRNLEVALNPRTQTVFNMYDCSDVRLENLDLHAGAASEKQGLLLQRSKNIVVDDSSFHDVGTAVLVYNSTGVTISDNDFRDIRGDGVQGNNSSEVTISGNYFTDFYPAPTDHPDAIQFFTSRQTTSSRDLVITGNTIVRGDGGPVQGIFLGNEAGKAYIDVTVSGNKLVGTLYHGIYLGLVDGASVTDNTVQAYADQDSWIMLEHSTNSTVSGNQTTSLILDKTNTGLTTSENTVLSATPVGTPAGKLAASPIEVSRGATAADTLTGSATDDQLWGGGGNDSVVGGDGSNLLRGEDGNDTLVGGRGFDDMHGNGGDDLLFGGDDDDWVVGGQGDDRLYGGDGRDLVYGQLGNDTCEGGSGNDTLTGGQANDVLNGGAGNDYLSGDRGDDTISGGTGADVFHMSGEAGLDLVVDFNASDGDRVLLDAGSRYTVSQSGADTVVTLDTGARMVLAGVDYASLKAGWIFGS